MGENAPMNELPGADLPEAPRNGFGPAPGGQPSQDDNSQPRQPRERRSRDRYGRDRRERNEGESSGRSEQAAEGSVTAFFAEPNQAPTQVEHAQAAINLIATAASTPVMDAPALTSSVVALPVRAPTPVPTPAPVQTPAAAPASATLPKVQSYDLPLQDLSQVAQASGLQWVNSDAAKIAEVNAAMAAEIKSIHVPRERPAVVVSVEGPLVLVETKRDLASMPLPFEKPAA